MPRYRETCPLRVSFASVTSARVAAAKKILTDKRLEAAIEACEAAIAVGSDIVFLGGSNGGHVAVEFLLK